MQFVLLLSNFQYFKRFVLTCVISSRHKTWDALIILNILHYAFNQILQHSWSTRFSYFFLLHRSSSCSASCPPSTLPSLTMSSWVVNRKGEPQYRRHFLTDNSTFHGKQQTHTHTHSRNEYHVQYVLCNDCKSREQTAEGDSPPPFCFSAKQVLNCKQHSQQSVLWHQ